MTEQILVAILNGILLGGVLALLASGLNLIFGVVKIIHMSYGQFVMIGFYLIFTFTSGLHIPLVASCVLAVIAMAILGLITQKLVINKLLNAPRANQLLALASLIIILENLSVVIWGADYRSIPIFLPILQIGNLFIRASYLLGFIGSLIVLAVLYLFLNKTYTGLAIRAVAQDMEIARLMGINTQKIFYITFAVGSALTGVVASFFVPIYTVHPHFGGSFTIMAFIIVVLGGMGNLLGGFIGAFIIGIITSVAAFLISAEVAAVIVLVIFIVVIIIRPQGLLGEAAQS